MPDLEGLDEVDRALAELKLKYGDAPEAPEAGPSQPSESRSVLAFRNLLSVDPKNLDADAELRRFFGSKVVSTWTLYVAYADRIRQPGAGAARGQDALHPLQA